MTLNKPLAKNLRSQLENTVKAAREVAEKAAHAALTHLGVGESEAPSHLTEDQKALRRRLRAHGRQLGDIKHANDTQPIRHLVWEVAYEHWHRMLFARFLAENHLLMWEPGAAVTLAECEELAQDPSTNLGAKSGWELAAILAARMLPQVFKPHSPVFELRFSPNEQRDLELLLKGLPTETFHASDSLGWVYQFWQAKRKDEVNASEVKIGADELPAVTQLFTEPYMVDFLLHNSLGAWWHTRHPNQTCPVELTYFRTLDDGTPAAGKFEGWPDSLAGFTLLDPCCGSGHFIVAAFLLLVPMRMASEGLSAKDAVDSVLTDNLNGLEIDPRCVEIAVFALALAAWRYPDESGNVLGMRAEMPSPNIASCGLKVIAKAQDWEALVPDTHKNVNELRAGLLQLHKTFANSPLFGSLLDPRKFHRGDLLSSDYDAVIPLLKEALARESNSTKTDEVWELALSAQGLLEAAHILEKNYHLVVTNVPYLGSSRQEPQLKHYCEENYPESKHDLANVFLERCLELSSAGQTGGVVQVVMPQNWLFLARYEALRVRLLEKFHWKLLAKLGSGAFETIGGEVVNVILLTLAHQQPDETSLFTGFDVSHNRQSSSKALLLKSKSLLSLVQFTQLSNPGRRILLDEFDAGLANLGQSVESLRGVVNGDNEKWLRRWWELTELQPRWEFIQQAVRETELYGGREEVIDWSTGGVGMLRPGLGNTTLGRLGIAVSRIQGFPATVFTGELYDQNTAVLCPKDAAFLPALWCFATSTDFKAAVRQLDTKVGVTPATFLEVSFDEASWSKVAIQQHPNGIPKPYADNPTQWIFHGHPCDVTEALQVATARLLGYTWPAESDTKMELSEEARTWIKRCKELANDVDDDGIICLRAVRGEKPAHERLLTLLINAWETVEPGSWKTSVLDKLLADVDSAGKGLDVWLQEKFFEQHAKLFQHRPFIWHIWDGLKDGFSALVNCHKLDTKNLERLIHTYLGDWIRTQEAEVIKGIDGAVLRLAAAQALKKKLEAIMEGEAPYDIFVRWKPLAQQPIGWNPDLNDGVRMNIRPFMTAEVLRHNKKPKLNITWDKDRGKDVLSAPWYNLGLQYDGKEGDRINDHHLTLAEKKTARDKADK